MLKNKKNDIYYQEKFQKIQEIYENIKKQSGIN